MHISYNNVFVRVGVQDNTGLMKLAGVPSSTLSNLPSPFTVLYCPCHLLNSTDYVRNQTMLHATTQGDAHSKDNIFPTRYKKKQWYPVSLNESLIFLCIYNTDTKLPGAFLSPSKVARLPWGVLSMDSQHPLFILICCHFYWYRGAASTKGSYFKCFTPCHCSLLQLQEVCGWLSTHYSEEMKI